MVSTIKTYKFKELTPKLKEELRKQVLMNFPKIKAFKTRFYYQIPPNYIFIAKLNNKIVGQRYLTTRMINIDNKKYKVAGIGISVNPNFHKKGIGQKLTKFSINFIKKQKYDLIMGTTKNPIAKHILIKFGFKKLKRKIKYKDLEINKIVTEKFDVLVKDFKHDTIIKCIESNRTPIFVGNGAW